MAVCRVINGAATSLGRVPIVLDIFAERDLARGTFTESEIQEFVDDFVMKLRTVKFARTKAYDQLYSGDPTFITTSMAGMGADGRHRVTKMDYRFLNTLDNIGNSPEPNLTVLWTDKLSLLIPSLLYENVTQTLFNPIRRCDNNGERRLW